MRERLIELICENIQDECIRHCNHPYCDKCKILADYLLANGVIVPPCKVGDKLYIIAEISGDIVECNIIGVWIFGNECSVITDGGTIHNKSFGKTVFLTKEEAENALKERKENEIK